MHKRIIGLDFARALAIIGMTIVNFKVVMGQPEESWLSSWASIFDGKAAALFVVLAGVGLSLLAKPGSEEEKNHSRKRVLKRALFLFVFGVLFNLIWPADILHFYGLYMLITAFLLYLSPTVLLALIFIFIFSYPLILGFIDYETGWNFETFEYLDFWTIKGFLRNLFVNGFHPVIPWAAFMFYGLWLGRQDLRDYFFVKKIFRLSGIIFLLIQLSSWGILSLFKGEVTAEEFVLLQASFGTAPMPPMPIYMFNGIAIATFLISGCILYADQYRQSPWILRFASMGRLALTIYVAHIVIGMGLVELALGKVIASMPFAVTLVYALVFSTAALLFSDLWLKRKKMGPLEWVMRRLTDG